MTNYQESERVVFDNEKNAFIVPKRTMDEIFRIIDELSVEDESDDLSDESAESLSNPFRNRSYCCEFTIVANGPKGEKKRETFRSFPGLAEARCIAIALQYAQPSYNLQRGRC